MAPIAKSLALAGSLFAALSTAAPVDRRGNVVVYETATEVVWTTVDVTTTVYPQSTQEAPAPPHTSVVSVTQVTPTETPEPVKPSQPEETQPAPTTSTSTTQAAPVVPQPTFPIQEHSTSEAQPTTTVAPTTSVVQPEPQPTQSAPSTGGSGSGSGYSGACSKDSPCTGQITYYDTATSASAPSSCGTTNDGSSENVLALPVGIMKDSDCGRTVTIKYGGVTKTGKVVDKCMGCDNTSIDLSRHFFSELAAFAEGRLFGVEWWME
ncbi:hypothetical protein BDV59DRAFT_123579 [Aspergillus ambiguus]|uniref:uncharacterized protein n=1 Tax=Aspergillus ambiguus TaxID=176160 RepID=UPI003CCD02CC